MDNYEKLVCFDRQRNEFTREILEEYFKELCEHESEIKKVKANVFDELNHKYNKYEYNGVEERYVQLSLDEIYIKCEGEGYLGAFIAILGKEFINLYYKENGTNDLSNLITILQIMVSDDYIIESKNKKSDYEKQKLILKNITLGKVNEFTSNNIKNLYMLKNKGIGFNFTLYSRNKKRLLKDYIIELMKITEDTNIKIKLKIIVDIIKG
ncbi:hypothetical protein [Clostridium sp. D53t1_180928_C8]|uniref:hypothetical protein n=1 Tax=Clostridium sp. D53t1_180928_C8 TaxID=2787101 RepID=UPI0018AC6E48|nr:hypothetical protein [Clostridium sp. D53t1_180928_C8]